MNFKDILKEDLDIFINPDELAEKIIIDGIEINGVALSAISDKNKLRLGNQGTYGYGEALYINQKEITFKTKDIPHRYKQGDRIEFNGELYEAILVKEELGMTSLIIGEQAN